MSLTQEQIIEMDKITGRNTVIPSVSNSRANEIRALAQTAQQEKIRTEEPLVSKFSQGVAKSTITPLVNLGSSVARQTVGRVVSAIEGKGFVAQPEEKNPVIEELNRPSESGSEMTGRIFGDIATFALPEMWISKALKVPKTIKGVVQIAKDVGISKLQTKDTEDALVTGGISTAVRTFIPAVRLLDSVFKRSLAVAGAKGSDVIQTIAKYPEEATKGLRGDPVKLLKDSAQKVIDYTKGFYQNAKTQYREVLANIEKNYDTLLQGFKNVPSKTEGGIQTIEKRAGTSIITDPQGNRFNLSISGAKSFITNSLKDFGVKGSTKGGFDFSNSSLNDMEQKIMNKVVDKINTWTDITPTGIDKLADVVKGYAREGSGSMQRANSIIWKMGSSIDDYLAERIPMAKEMRDSYTQAMRFMDELRINLSAIGKGTPDEIADVSSRIQNLFTTNKETARAFIESLPGGKEIVGGEAGRQLAKEEISRASGSIGNFIANIIQTVVPPKAIGEIATKLGVAENVATKIYETLKPLAPETHAGIINLIRESINQK